MGGTFDPIHIGHLILGETAYEQFHLDKVLFMPAGNPPHKKTAAVVQPMKKGWKWCVVPSAETNILSFP